MDNANGTTQDKQPLRIGVVIFTAIVFLGSWAAFYALGATFIGVDFGLSVTGSPAGTLSQLILAGVLSLVAATFLSLCVAGAAGLRKQPPVELNDEQKLNLELAKLHRRYADYLINCAVLAVSSMSFDEFCVVADLRPVDLPAADIATHAV